MQSLCCVSSPVPKCNSDYFRSSLTVGYKCSVHFSHLFQGKFSCTQMKTVHYLEKLLAECRYTSIKTVSRHDSQTQMCRMLLLLELSVKASGLS